MKSSANSPVLIYTVHKAASMFLHRIMREMTEELGVDVEYYSINKCASMRKEITETSWSAFIERNLALAEKRAWFGPIRSREAMPSVPEDIEKYSVILHLRDPRDVLVSSYFSNAFSHQVRPEIFNPSEDLRRQWIEAGIDAFVVQKSETVINRYSYVIDHLWGRENVLFLKYEDMVLNYSDWLSQFLSVLVPEEQEVPSAEKLGVVTMLKKLLPLQTDERSPQLSFDELYEKLYEGHKADFQVENEDVYQHKRQVLPGDHLRKLKPETIATLNDKFSNILKTLGYQ